jgi:pimeloyl-ACP methyl ester carboxylesterase
MQFFKASPLGHSETEGVFMRKQATVVLVHGAWADGSSWSRVITGLGVQGIKAVAAPLPLTSLADDVAALDRSLERVNGPVVLAGHAYAGGVIGASRHPNIKGLVYVAALAPAEGETVADVFYRNPPHPQAPQLAPNGHGLIWLPEEAFPAAFAQNASPEELTVLAAVQRPISPACITVPVPRPLWQDLPSWYLLAKQDRMIVEPTQRFMAERMKARISEHEVDHTPSVTAPDVVVNLLLQAVREVQA